MPWLSTDPDFHMIFMVQPLQLGVIQVRSMKQPYSYFEPLGLRDWGIWEGTQGARNETDKRGKNDDNGYSMVH